MYYELLLQIRLLITSLFKNELLIIFLKDNQSLVTNFILTIRLQYNNTRVQQ